MGSDDAASSPLRVSEGGVRLRLRVTPKASANRIGTVVADGAGDGWLQITVTAVPQDGRANRAVIALLAQRWKLAKSAMTVVRGLTDRRKTVEITAEDPTALIARLTELIAESS